MASLSAASLRVLNLIPKALNPSDRYKVDITTVPSIVPKDPSITMWNWVSHRDCDTKALEARPTRASASEKAKAGIGLSSSITDDTGDSFSLPRLPIWGRLIVAALLLPLIGVGSDRLTLAAASLSVAVGLAVAMYVIRRSLRQPNQISSVIKKSESLVHVVLVGMLIVLVSSPLTGLWLISVVSGSVWTGWASASLLAGDLLLVTGVTTWWGATRQLKSYWVNGIVIQTGQPLFTTGWYQVCRYPVYLGDTLTVTGGFLAFGGPLAALSIFAIAWYALRPRIAGEEGLLKETYGAGYLTYATEMQGHVIVPRWTWWARCLLTTWGASG